jgi:hypothetical protein
MANEEQAKPLEVLRKLPLEQSATAAHVVIAPHLPAMEKIGEVKTVQRNTLLPLMGAGHSQSTGGEGVMAPVPAKMPASPPHRGKAQEPKPGQVGLSSVDGYVRMEVHVENGQLSVIGVKQVPGPLAMPSALIRGYAYEVLQDEQQVALGSVPDVGVRRAFANRDVEGPQGKHHFTNVPTFDFFVRIPKGHVTEATLPKLNIVLHKVEDAPERLTSLAALQKQPGVKTVEVGRLAGIKLEQLPAAVRPHLEEILSETEKPR